MEDDALGKDVETLLQKYNGGCYYNRGSVVHVLIIAEDHF